MKGKEGDKEHKVFVNDITEAVRAIDKGTAIISLSCQLAPNCSLFQIPRNPD